MLFTAESCKGARIFEGDTAGIHLYYTPVAHLVENLGDGLPSGSDHGSEILMGEAQIYGYEAVVALAELLGQQRQQVCKPHLGLAGQQALDQLLVLHEAQLQKGHQLEGGPRFLSDGAFDEDLGYFRHPALRNGLGVSALPGLPGEGQMAEDIPGLEQAQRRLFAARVGPEELEYARGQHIEGITVLALVVDGVPRRVDPVGRGYSHLTKELQ